MKYLILYLLFISTIVLAYGFAYSLTPDDPDGKEVFVGSKCNTCHTVTSAGVTSKKKDASDLSDTGGKYNAEFLKKYLNKKEKIDGKQHKTAFKGTEKELDALANWLGSLKSEK